MRRLGWFQSTPVTQRMSSFVSTRRQVTPSRKRPLLRLEVLEDRTLLNGSSGPVVNLAMQVKNISENTSLTFSGSNWNNPSISDTRWFVLLPQGPTDQNSTVRITTAPTALPPTSAIPPDGLVVDLVASHGTIHALGANNVTVSGSDSSDVTLRGNINDINSWFGNTGFAFNPTPYFDGTATLHISATDEYNNTGVKDAPIDVYPVARGATISVNSPATSRQVDGVTAIPLSISAVPIAQDGSEQVDWVFFQNVPQGWSFNHGHAARRDFGINTRDKWWVSADQLPSLTITPPTGASGDFHLTFNVFSTDTATFTDGTPTTKAYWQSDSQSLEVIVGATSVSVPSMADLQEGSSGPVSAMLSDPVSQYQHEWVGVKLQVTNGTLAVPQDFYSLYPYSVYHIYSVQGEGSSQLGFYGPIDSIQSVLDAGQVTFTPSAFYSGEANLTAFLQPYGGNPVTASNTITVYPVAAIPYLTAPTDLSGQVGQTVPLAISVPGSPDTDGSESTALVIEGVPDGATLSPVAVNQGQGTWTVDRNNLSDLQITLPSTPGAFTLIVHAVTTDAASYPSSGTAETVTQDGGYAAILISSMAPPVNPPLAIPGYLDCLPPSHNGTGSILGASSSQPVAVPLASPLPSPPATPATDLVRPTPAGPVSGMALPASSSAATIGNGSASVNNVSDRPGVFPPQTLKFDPVFTANFQHQSPVPASTSTVASGGVVTATHLHDMVIGAATPSDIKAFFDNATVERLVSEMSSGKPADMIAEQKYRPPVEALAISAFGSGNDGETIVETFDGPLRAREMMVATSIVAAASADDGATPTVESQISTSSTVERSVEAKERAGWIRWGSLLAVSAVVTTLVLTFMPRRTFRKFWQNLQHS